MTNEGGRPTGLQPSFSARLVAHVRAGLDRPSAPTGDAEVATRLAADLKKPLPLLINRTVVSYVRGRTQFFDTQVLEAIGGAPAQVVLVGAGYDDRALRFRTPGVRFIEVDHPVTQEDKRRRLARLGLETSDVSFLPVDLETTDPSPGLQRLVDPSLGTTILCEAVLPYLSPARTRAVLGELRRCPGSSLRLAVDVPEVPANPLGRVAVVALRLGAAAVGEHIRTVFRPGETSQVLEAGGWVLESRTSGRELGMSAASAGATLVVAVDPTRPP